MSSALLIAKYLGAEKQAELIENLLVDIQKKIPKMITMLKS